MQELPFNLDCKDAVSRLDDPQYVWIDVREDHEFAFGHAPNMHHIPLSQFTMGHLDQFDAKKTLVIVCRSGNRSQMVTDTLRKMGRSNVQNLAGGLLALNGVLSQKIPVLSH